MKHPTGVDRRVYAMHHIVNATPNVRRVRSWQFWLSFVVGTGFMALIFLAWVATP